MLIRAKSVNLTLIGRAVRRYEVADIEIKDGVVRIGNEIFPLGIVELITYEQ